jgi:chromate reductase, NAD(P)H dehydrogenase (quinone)
MHPHDSILVISGTNRPASSTLRVAARVAHHYREAQIRAELLNLEELPVEMFKPEAYKNRPAALEAIQQRVIDAAGLHVVLPEYNGSFPGVLKYFIDLLKFPESFDRKPVAFVGVASGAWGGLRAVEQMQMVFGYRNAHLYPDRVFISGVAGKLAADGSISDAAIDERLSKQVLGFAVFCGLFGRKKRC